MAHLGQEAGRISVPRRGPWLCHEGEGWQRHLPQGQSKRSWISVAQGPARARADQNPIPLGPGFGLLCQAPSCTTRCFLCQCQAKASSSFSTGLHLACRGMPRALPRRAWSRGALTFFSGLVTTQSPAGLTPSHCLTGERKLSQIHSVK